MPTSKKPRAIAFIDGANMFYTQRKLGWMVDWQKMKQYLAANFNVREFRYYVGINQEDADAESFLNSLRKIGYVTVTKPLKKIRLEPPQKGYIHKANFDVEMTCDIFLLRDWFNHLVLLSGDSDFAYLLQKLKREGKIITVLCSRNTLGWELKLATRNYVYLEDIKKEVYRKEWGSPGKQASKHTAPKSA